jgi:hypothetical protein
VNIVDLSPLLIDKLADKLNGMDEVVESKQAAMKSSILKDVILFRGLMTAPLVSLKLAELDVRLMKAQGEDIAHVAYSRQSFVDHCLDSITRKSLMAELMA